MTMKFDVSEHFVFLDFVSISVQVQLPIKIIEFVTDTGENFHQIRAHMEWPKYEQTRALFQMSLVEKWAKEHGAMVFDVYRWTENSTSTYELVEGYDLLRILDNEFDSTKRPITGMFLFEVPEDLTYRKPNLPEIE